MFKYQLGEEVRDENYAYYKSRYKYRVSGRHYNEYLSDVGELLYNRTYMLTLMTDNGGRPTASLTAGFFGVRKDVAEKDVVTEIVYQQQLAAAALPTGSP